MFISIDHGKRPSDYKIHLAKPNKEIIAVLHEKHNSTLNLRLGNIFELNFSIPYFIENNDLQMINNPNVEKIKELMYLKLTWGELEEWFLIDNITESSEDNEIMNVQAFSIGYEHKRKRISEFSKTAINATEFYTEVLRDSPWTIGEIDSSFNSLFRSFDESGTDRFELIKVGAETFGGVILWDTHNKKISLKEPDNIGEFKGLIVNYDRLMTSLSKTRTTDEMVTRLYVYGNERISIENKNPTSERYIEDYSYFMYPFKRDANKNVLAHSHYMSDELCHALLDNQELRKINEPKIKTLQGSIESRNALLSSAMIDLDNAEFTLMTAKGLLDIAKAVNDTALITQRKAEVASAETTLKNKETAVKNLRSEIEGLQKQITNLQKAISIRSFTKELIDELEPYIIEKEIEDSRYIDEGELFEFAKDKFAEIREPRVVIETGIEGLMNSVEEQYYWDKLNLGDTMQVKQKRMNINYKSKIIEINVNLDTSDAEVKIANFTENVDNLDKFISILYSSESNSTILNNNKHKWDSVVDMRDEVTQLRESEIDATKKRITAGVNESVEIGDRGIVITTPSFPNEMIIMQAGVIALSEDGGNNWKTSVTPRGVIADTIIGKLVASNNLIVTNDSGSMVLDGTGLTVDADSIKIMSGGSNPKNIIEDWNNMIIDMDNFADDNVLTPYEKSQILHQWNMISDAHTKLIESFIDNMGNETDENPYPLEYDIYLETYDRLRNFLFTDKQSDGYSMLDSSRMQFVSPVSSESYRSTLTNYMTAKDDFILVIPMEYTNASIRVLEEGIFLEYVKSDELVASLNLSEEGVRIDGKLLSINSETRFRDDVVMDAGVIKSADNAIRIDLNAGTIDLARPLTINAVPVATKEDIENIEMTYTPVLSNDTANIPTDENGNNGNYYTANTEISIYQQSKDDTINWTITADKSAGITGSLSGNKYTVTNMTTDVGYVDLIAKKSEKTLVKRFTLSKSRDGQSGRIPPMLSLSSTGQIMTFDSGNNPTPSLQEIQVIAKVNNYEGQVSWKIEKFNGNSLVETLTPAKNSQNTIMINQSVMTGNITSVRVTAYDLSANSNFSDYITIYKLKESMDGVGIEGITEYYLATSQATGVTSSTSGFTTTIQTMTDVNRYLWNYEKIKYTDGTDKNTVPVIIGVHGQKGIEGEVGRSITSITEHYLATSLESGVSRGTSGWTTSMQQTDDTKRYLWNYETINWNKAPLTTYVEPVIIGVHGKKGEDGYTPVKGTDYFDGKDGQNGVSSYVWVRYSQNSNGNPMVTSPTNAKYVGLATTTTQTAPKDYTAYNWTLIKGTDGVQGETGADGKSSYMHIKYSDDGTTFTANNGETEGKWIGILVDFVEADSNKFSDYTWNKVAGEDGSDAKLLYLSSTAETMTFNSDNKPNPATQTITFTANLQNTTGTATFTAIPYNGTTAMTAITLGGSGNTRTLTQSQFPTTATRVEIKATLGGLSDTVSVVKLKNGATGGTGADGKNAIVGYLTNENVTFPANSLGVVTSANLAMANGVFKVFDGLTEKTGSGVTYSVVTQTGVTGAITTTGAYSVSAISAYNASITFRAIYSGVTIDKVLTLSKSKEGYTPVKGTDYFDGKDGQDGSDGDSSFLWVRYSQNANGNPMTDSPTDAKYVGLATTNTSTAPTVYSAYKWSLVKGTDGINGEKGANGKTSYLHIKYSNDGGATFTANSGETVGDWIGTYVDFTEADSTLVSKYTWNKVKGETGARGATGSQGPKGDTGTSVSSVTEYYLATASSTGVTSTTSGWTTSIQTMTATNKYLWNYEKINFSDGTSQPTIPVIIGVYGDKGQTGSTGATGRSITAIQEYYLATSASTGVTRSTDGWKTTMQTTTPTNKYLWNYEKITWSSGTTTTYVEPIIIGIHGETGSDGISPIVGFLTNEAIALPATDTGVVSSFTGATGTFNVYEGTVLKNAQATYSVVSPSNITVSITQSGVYTVSAMTTGTSVLSGTATLRAVYDGVTVDKILSITKSFRGIQGETGQTGATGSSATSYWLTTSNNVIKKDVQNNIVPTSVTFSGFQKVGTNNPTAYSGRFIISTSVNGKDYTNVYTSSSNQTTYVYTVPKDVNFIKARLYQSGGTSILLDEQTVPVLVDAEGIEVGGRNYFTKNTPVNMKVAGSGFIVRGSDTPNGFRITGVKEGNTSIRIPNVITSNGWWTVSFDIKGTQDTPASVTVDICDKGGVRVTSNGTNTYERRAVSVYVDNYSSTYNFVDFDNFAWMYFLIDNIKVEKGNKATDWTPAPEDIQEQIENKADIEAVNNLKNETIPALKDGLLNSSEKEAVKQSLNVVSADKKGIDTQFTTVYANTALTGTAKTNLNSAKVALNTAFSNLQSAINTVLGVKDGTRITTTQMTLVTTRLNEYGTALSTYNQRYEQAQDAISTEKKRLGEVYAKAQATLAETQAKAHADGKVTAEEKRAIADAKAKLAEAKKYVDDVEIGGRNLLANSGEIITNGAYNIARYDLTIPPSQGDLMTVTIKGNLASTKSHFAVYNSGGSVSLGALASIGGGLYTRTFNWNIGSSSNTYLNVYAFTNAQVGESTIEWIKLEKGNKATDWTPAPEDIQTEIDNKANQEDLGSVEDSLNKLYTVVNDIGVQTIKDQLAEYQGILSGVEADSQEAKTKLDNILSEENGALARINTILDNFNQRWTTLDGFLEINSSETALSISKGDTNMVIDSKALTFYSGRTPVATITNQYMKIDRGIFVESMQVGRHLWAPSKNNRDHFVLSYSGDAPS